MSCIAGIHSPAGLASRETVERMVAAMRARAPDGIDVASAGPIALGQAHLVTGSRRDEQPCALAPGAATWIVADARLDDRAALVGKLRARGHPASADAPAADLIALAYAAFGCDLVQHLLGDFAFAIWDSAQQRLVCARDHFGVRPLYWSRTGSGLHFASDMQALLDAGTPADFDDEALAEYLLLGTPLDAAVTPFRHIRMLAPASMLIAQGGAVTVREYWQLQAPARIRLRRRQDYVQQFGEIFRAAVLDRVPAGPAVFPLTGGMDSTSIAAVAVPALRSAGFAATAFHHTTQSVIPEDDEKALAAATAQMLGMELHTFDLATAPLFANAGTPQLRTSQPLSTPHLEIHRRTIAAVGASGARVWFSGFMGDAALTPDLQLGTLLRRGALLDWLKEGMEHVRLTRSLRGLGLRAAWRAEDEDPPWRPAMPDWIVDPTPGHLARTWERFWDLHRRSGSGLAQLRLPWFSRQFAALEALPAPLVVRYPFLDLRLVQFLAAIPPGLVTGKRILREALRGQLPEAVLARPKLSAPGDVVRTMVTNGIFAFDAAGLQIPGRMDAGRFASVWDRYRAGAGADATWSSWLMMQTVAVHAWLANNPKDRKG